MECLNYVWVISSMFFFCKCMECSMAQYLQKGMDLFEYFPFKELHRAFFLYWFGAINEVNNEFLTWRAPCHTLLCITMEYSMRQNLTKAMENSTLLQLKFNLNSNPTQPQHNLNSISTSTQFQLNLNLNSISTSTQSHPQLNPNHKSISTSTNPQPQVNLNPN